ncbi:unnamed protein product [Orchesella dallaii]|uniref:SET domain-containing protein n=1 Tax=Orchesella dallaii TaxID=48710 RepID=A0ABP1PKX3_9HEXA
MDKYLQIRKDECSKAPSSPFLNFKNGQCLLQDVSNMEVPKCRCKRSCNTQYCENLAERRQCKKTCPAIKCQNRWGDCVNEKIYMNVFCVGTPQDGVGISAKLDLKMGLIVGEYVGEYLTREVYQERRSTVYKNKQHFYGIEVESAYIDANKFGNFSKFINHCKTYPNLVTEIWRVDELPRLYFRTLCDIPKGTELTFDYNMKDFDPQPCRCSTCSPNKSAISFKPSCFKKQPELLLERQSLRSTLKTLVDMESQTGDINAGIIDPSILPSVPVELAIPAAASDVEESTHSANIAFHVLDENVATSTTTEIKKRKRIVESDGDFYCTIQECT